MVQAMVVYLIKGSVPPEEEGEEKPMVSGSGQLQTTGYTFTKVRHSSSEDKTIITMKSEVSYFGGCVGNCTDLHLRSTTSRRVFIILGFHHETNRSSPSLTMESSR